MWRRWRRKEGGLRVLFFEERTRRRGGGRGWFGVGAGVTVDVQRKKVGVRLLQEDRIGTTVDLGGDGEERELRCRCCCREEGEEERGGGWVVAAAVVVVEEERGKPSDP